MYVGCCNISLDDHVCKFDEYFIKNAHYYKNSFTSCYTIMLVYNEKYLCK